MNKREFIKKYNITEATFSNENTRKSITKKELAIIRALCGNGDGKKGTIGLVADDISNVDASIENINGNVDFKFCHRGDTSKKTLVSFWSRNNVEKHVSKVTDKRDYGVRLHEGTFITLYEGSEDFRTRVTGMPAQVFKYDHGYEVRYTFSKVADAVTFIFDLETIENALDEDVEVINDTVEVVGTDINDNATAV